jgi:hypothetical protein
MHTKFWSEDLGVDGRIILVYILEKNGGNVWTGYIWLRIRLSGGTLVNTVTNLRVP